MNLRNVIFMYLSSAAPLTLTTCQQPQQTDSCDEVRSFDSTKYKVQFFSTQEFSSLPAATDDHIKSVIAGAFNKSNTFADLLEDSAFFEPLPINGVPPQKISTRNLIQSVFNQTGDECLKGSDRIRRFAKDKVPDNLRIHTIDSTMNYYEGISGISILSHLKVKHADGRVDNFTLPSTRVGITSILDLINPADADSYVYQMDCSGYFSFALSIATGRPKVAELSAAGEASSKGNKSSIVAYGMFTSPLAIALKPGAAFNLEFDNPTRKQVLTNILNSPNAPLKDNDVIIVNNYYYLLITSTTGSSGFTGRLDINSAGSGGVGLIRGNFSTGAGGTYSRAVRFSNYRTYVSTRFDNGSINETAMTVADIKKAIKSID